MVDLRYHIASLIGVFLALTVGIVVGSSLGSSERQTAAVRHLQTQFAAVMAEDHRIQEENTRQRDQLEAREEVIGQLAPLAVRDRLAGQRVSLVVCGTGEPPESLPALRETLRLAGAELISSARLPAPFGPLPPADRARLIAALDADGDARSPEEVAIAAIGQAVATGDSSRRLHELASLLSIGLEGEYRLPARRLVLLCAGPADAPSAGAGEKTTAFSGAAAAAVMARAAASAGAMVVVGETEEMPPLTALRGLTDQGISTIDNMDTAAGRVALVLVLAGARGNYGAKSAAGRVLPPLDAGP